jgi:hypothetical protein
MVADGPVGPVLLGVAVVYFATVPWGSYCRVRQPLPGPGSAPIRQFGVGMARPSRHVQVATERATRR